MKLLSKERRQSRRLGRVINCLRRQSRRLERVINCLRRQSRRLERVINCLSAQSRRLDWVFGDSAVNSSIKFTLLEIKSRFTCRESNIYKNVALFLYIISAMVARMYNKAIFSWDFLHSLIRVLTPAINNGIYKNNFHE